MLGRPTKQLVFGYSIKYRFVFLSVASLFWFIFYSDVVMNSTTLLECFVTELVNVLASLTTNAAVNVQILAALTAPL